jgi:hypothetical protein
MASLVYVLSALTSALCAVLLLRDYRRTSGRLLLWSGLAFGGFAVANALVFADLVLVRDIDLSILRAATAFAAVSLLLYGLIWDSR